MTYDMQSQSTPSPQQEAGTKERVISLRRLFAVVAFAAAFFGFCGIAVREEVDLAALAAVISLSMSIGLLTRRYRWSFAFVIFVAFVSMYTYSIRWSGGFPFSQIRIHVVDQDGSPLEGVELTVTPLRGTTKGYPIAEYMGEPLYSDSEGLIVCHQTANGIQFGGSTSFLFWFIPVGAKAPRFDVHLRHADCASESFEIQRLFESEHQFYDDFPKTTIELDGVIEEIPIREHRIELQRR